MQKARSRKHPGLKKRRNRFYTTTDRPERHEHLLRVCSDKWATQLRKKATYIYAPLSRHIKKASLSFVHPFLTRTTWRPPWEPRTIAHAPSSPRGRRPWTADQRDDRSGRRPPPHPVFTCYRPHGAKGKPRIPHVGVALGTGARRAAAPTLIRRRRRSRACAAAAAQHYLGARAHTRGTLMRGAARGAIGGPCPIGWRGGRRVLAGGGVPTVRRWRPSGRPPQAAHTRSRAQRRWGPPAGGGEDHRRRGAGSGVPNP